VSPRAALLLAVLALACDARPGTLPADAGSAPTAAAAAASPGRGSLGMMGSMLAQNVGAPGPYDEPKASADLEEDEPHAAVLELRGRLVELAPIDLFGGLLGGDGPSVELRGLLDRLAALRADDDIAALLLRVGELSMSAAGAEELRAGLLRFKDGEPRKKLYCHTESASDLTYLVLSACDEIGLAPTGTIAVTGASAAPIHVKGALDRLGVVADFLHVGAFKGAAEPLTRERPSPEMIETLDAILDQSYATLVAGIAAGRRLSEAAVRDLVDRALFVGDDARAAELVDRVEIFERFRHEVLAGGPWQVVALGEEPGLGKLMELLGVAPRRRPSGARVALVYAVGEVVDGKGDGVLGARRAIASRPLIAALRVLAADAEVKAIVLRVDSPGGSALASELIWHAVSAAAATKPVVVSMGSVAASGGYYISAGATRIFADANTLTGSIGVVGGKLALGGALDKIGVQSFPMGRGKRATMMTSLSPWTDDERGAVQAMMEATYRTFTARVATGRKLAPAEVEPLARGRVWTGAAASKRRLVDELGDLEAALAWARTAGKVDAGRDLEVYPPDATLIDYLQSIGGVRLPLGLAAVAAEVEERLGGAAGRAVNRLFRQALRFSAEPVQTVFFDPRAG
jgi:protease-4